MTKEKRDNLIYLKNRSVGFRISIPDTFIEVKKEMYSKLGVEQNTLYLFSVDRQTSFSVTFAGFSNSRDFEKLAKFNAEKFKDEELVLIASEKETYKDLQAYSYYLQKQNKKIRNTIVLINDMLVNFSLNFDHKNMLKEIKDFKKSKESLLLDEILKSLKTFTPVNPPMMIEEPVKVVEEVEEKAIELPAKSLSQTIVETECKYRGIKVPNFYFKYNYFKNGEVVLLTTIDKELYFSGFRDSFVVIDNGDLSAKLKDITLKHFEDLMKMDISGQRPKSNSSIVSKLNDKYLYIDLESDTDKAVLNKFFIELLSIFKEAHISGKEIFPAGMYNEEVEEVVVEPEVYKIPDEEILSAVIIEEPTVEVVPEEVVEIVEAPVVETKIINEKESRLNAPELNIEMYDTEAIYHFMNGAPIFTYHVPKDYAHKIVREYNAFDLDKNGEVVFRIFMFPCETKDSYEVKVKDWMDKNIHAAGGLEEEKLELLSTGQEVKTYLLNNDKFYKTIYSSGYLIAISGMLSVDNLSIASFILSRAEQTEASPGYIEAFDRKLRNFELLKSENIPYLSELPLLDSTVDAHYRSVDEVARRAIALCISANFAIDVANTENKKELKTSKKFFTKLLDKYKAKNYLSNREKELFDSMDKDLAIQISWQLEGLVVLFWALKLIDELSYPKELINPSSMSSILSDSKNYVDFINKCELRPMGEILDFADLTYRYDWYCEDARRNGVDIDEKINAEIVLERNHAFTWLIQDLAWDDINIDT